MGQDLISRRSLIKKLENEFCSKCSVCSERCRHYKLLKMIQKHPSAYDAEWVESRITSMFQHHTATKTVRRLVLEAVHDGYSAAVDNSIHD